MKPLLTGNLNGWTCWNLKSLLIVNTMPYFDLTIPLLVKLTQIENFNMPNFSGYRKLWLLPIAWLRLHWAVYATATDKRYIIELSNWENFLVTDKFYACGRLSSYSCKSGLRDVGCWKEASREYLILTKTIQEKSI